MIMEQAHENKMTRDETLKVALMVGKILLKSGAETYRVEDTINRFCIANGYEVDIFVTPTVIILGFNEPTATVMWNTLARHELSAFDTILWNIFPFHPHKKDDLLTNRTPTNEELDAGIEYAKMLLALVPTLKIVAIGQKSAGTLQRYGVECVACVPHPSMGGANRFKAAVAQLFTNGE